MKRMKNLGHEFKYIKLERTKYTQSLYLYVFF